MYACRCRQLTKTECEVPEISLGDGADGVATARFGACTTLKHVLYTKRSDCEEHKHSTFKANPSFCVMKWKYGANEIQV